MPHPRPRFTVRRLMIAVAVVAGIAGMAKRSRDFRRTAEQYGAVYCPSPNSTPEQVRSLARFNEFQEQMSRKYRFAAWTPFLPVLPDPPGPE